MTHTLVSDTVMPVRIYTVTATVSSDVYYINIFGQKFIFYFVYIILNDNLLLFNFLPLTFHSHLLTDLHYMWHVRAIYVK